MAENLESYLLFKCCLYPRDGAILELSHYRTVENLGKKLNLQYHQKVLYAKQSHLAANFNTVLKKLILTIKTYNDINTEITIRKSFGRNNILLTDIANDHQNVAPGSHPCHNYGFKS